MEVMKVVPATVPSLFHSPETALKMTEAPRRVKARGVEPEAPAKTSLSRIVPASVPSLHQGSWPVLSFVAEKNTPVPPGVSSVGAEPRSSGRRSSTRGDPGTSPCHRDETSAPGRSVSAPSGSSPSEQLITTASRTTPQALAPHPMRITSFTTAPSSKQPP